MGKSACHPISTKDQVAVRDTGTGREGTTGKRGGKSERKVEVRVRERWRITGKRGGWSERRLEKC